MRNATAPITTISAQTHLRRCWSGPLSTSCPGIPIYLRSLELMNLLGARLLQAFGGCFPFMFRAIDQQAESILTKPCIVFVRKAHSWHPALDQHPQNGEKDRQEDGKLEANDCKWGPG